MVDISYKLHGHGASDGHSLAASDLGEAANHTDLAPSLLQLHDAAGRWEGQQAVEEICLVSLARNILYIFQDGIVFSECVFMPELVFQENTMINQSMISLGTTGA